MNTLVNLKLLKEMGPMAKQIIVYTMKNCSFCTKQKDWMEMNNIQFEERDISINENNIQEFIELKGQGAPLTIIRNEDVSQQDIVVTGFNKKHLKNALL